MSTASVHRYSVGTIDVLVVDDGHVATPITDGLVLNASADDVRQSLRDAGLPSDLLTTSFAPVIIRSAGLTVLIDTGLGPDMASQSGGTAGLLVGNLRNAGLAPEAIDLVVISHCHPDHVNGLVSREGLVFPNARVLVPEAEWSFWMSDREMLAAAPGRMSQLFANNRRVLDQVHDRVMVYGWGDEVAPGLTAVGAPGHSIGHTAYWLKSGAERLFIQSDLSNQPALQVRHPEWQSALDQFPLEAVETRRRCYEQLARDRIPIQAFHHPFPGRCILEADGTGYRRAAIA